MLKELRNPIHLYFGAFFSPKNGLHMFRPLHWLLFCHDLLKVETTTWMDFYSFSTLILTIYTSHFTSLSAVVLRFCSLVCCFCSLCIVAATWKPPSTSKTLKYIWILQSPTVTFLLDDVLLQFYALISFSLVHRLKTSLFTIMIPLPFVRQAIFFPSNKYLCVNQVPLSVDWCSVIELIYLISCLFVNIVWWLFHK